MATDGMTDIKQTNISSLERWSTAIGGGALATYGLLKKTPGSYALASLGAYLVFRGASGHCPAYSAAGINAAVDTDTPEAVRKKLGDVGIKVTHSVSVNKSADEMYAFWRDFTNLPRIMDHLESVTIKSGALGKHGGLGRRDHQRGSRPHDRLALTAGRGRG